MVRGRGKTSIMAVLYKLVARVSCRSGRWTRLRVYPFFFQTKAFPPINLSLRGGWEGGGGDEQKRGRLYASVTLPGKLGFQGAAVTEWMAY